MNQWKQESSSYSRMPSNKWKKKNDEIQDHVTIITVTIHQKSTGAKTRGWK